MTDIIYQYQQGYVPDNGNAFYFWVDCSKEVYEEERTEGGVVRTLYTAPPPAALPPEVTEQDAPLGCSAHGANCWMVGANWMRERTKALGGQPPKEFVVASKGVS